MKIDFINSDFLLESPLAQTLYHDYVEGLPIADYHNHLNPIELASNHRFGDIGELWVASDPYKHRAMRLHGENESVISGSASTREKFGAWSRTLPHTLGNPLFHWSAMEMKGVFGMEQMPDPTCTDKVWSACNHSPKMHQVLLPQRQDTLQGSLESQVFPSTLAQILTQNRLLAKV